MSEDRLFHTVILPVQAGISRPVWSVMIPTYNCAAYLRVALCSVLAQDPGPDHMQIEVVDDCSTQDDPAAVVAEVGDGRVVFHRQPHNVGHCRNFDTCLERSHGHPVHLLHGDDGVREGFYQKMERAFAEHPEIGAAFCRYISMPTRPVTTIRWIARITGTLFVVVFLVFFIPDWGQKGTMPVPSDRVPMVLSLFLAFVGLTMAWKWEGAGGMVALAGLVAYCVLGLQTDVKPAATILLTGAYALPAILFVVHGWQARRASGARKAGAARRRFLAFC